MPPSRGCLALASGRNGRLILSPHRLQPARPYPLCSSSRSLSSTALSDARSQRPRVRAQWPSQAPCLSAVGFRSLSLWGWGSNTSREGFSELHAATPTSTPPTATTTPPQVTQTPEVTQTPPTAPTNAQDLSSLDLQQALEAIGQSQSTVPDIPERIGYFSELGLNFGWGPTSIIEWTLEHVHIYSGTPWWASIVITASIFRIMMVPLIIKQSDAMARMGLMKDEMEKVKADLQRARDVNDPSDQLYAQQQLMKMKEAIGPLKWLYLPILVQAPLGYCTWKFLRHGSDIPVPGWQDGGFLWLHDLTVADPYYVTPFIFMTVMHIIGRLGGEAGGQNAMSATMRPVMRYVLPGFTGLIMIFQPIAVAMTFITSMVFGVGQSLLLRNPGFRRWANLTPMPRPKTAETVSPRVIDAAARVKVAPEYQPPTPPTKPPGGAASKWGSFKKEWGDAVEPMRKKYAQDGSQLDASGRTKDFIKRADQHEKRRRDEEKRKRQGRY